MKLKFLFVLLCFSIQANSQLSFLNQNSNFFSNPRSGFEFENLDSTVLLVEAFEKTGKKCADKTIINEYGFSIIEPIVFHCPYKKMSSQQKKELGTFNELIDQNQEKQKEYWQQYQKKFQIISKNEKELSKYDKSTFRFILTYQYVAAFNGNQEMHYAIRYQLYDRIKNKEYAALEILDANTDQEEFSNLEQVIKHLNN